MFFICHLINYVALITMHAGLVSYDLMHSILQVCQPFHVTPQIGKKKLPKKELSFLCELFHGVPITAQRIMDMCQDNTALNVYIKQKWPQLALKQQVLRVRGILRKYILYE